MCLISRCNEGYNQSASWNPSDSSHCNSSRLHPQEAQQNDLERPPSQDLPPPSPPSPLSHPHSLPQLKKHFPILTTSNGRTNLLGLGLGSGTSLGLAPGQGVSGQSLAPGHSLGLGVGDCGPGLGVGQNSLAQELTELEGHIHIIKQQLQSAMRRKRELELYQSANQLANQPPNQTSPNQPTHQSNQAIKFTQCSQSHQQTNKHTNTLPEF